MSVVEELSGDGSRIVTSWKRTTVADGDWLQFNTIRPLNERDVFLAEKIDELSGNSDDRLDEEIKARKNADTFLSGTIDTFSGNYETFKSKTESNIDYLSGSIDGLKEDLDTEKEDRSREDGLLQAQIDTIKAATDVIMVYGDYHTFTANSGDLILTDADVIKVLVDESTNDKQVYYQWYDPKLEHEWSGWSGIGSLDPYYSKAEIDELEEQLSATIANTYLSANGTDISAGKNLDVVIKSNNPRVAFKTKDDVSFTNVTATNIQGTQANYTNFSGVYITGFNDTENLTATISGLINSAANGGSMTAIKNASGIMLNWDENKIYPFTTSADLISLYVSGGASEWIGFDIDRMNNAITVTGNLSPILENYLPVNWSGYNNSLFSGTSRSAQSAYSSQFAGSADLANSASIAANTQDKITAYYKEGNTNKTGTFNVSSLKLSAGKGINFVSADNQLSISSEGTTYTTGQYINISNDNKISVTGDLINSAQSGQSAYNWITAQSATLSAGFGIQFTSAGQNTMGIKLNAVLNEDDKIVSIGGKELVGGDDYIPYSAVEVKTMGTDKCVGSLTSGSNVLKIAATYAYKDENGDRIDTNYLKISAFGNYVSANPYGISISSDSVVKLVFTPTLPSTLDDNTYYIV